MKLCQPASIILLVSVAGLLYHLVTGSVMGMLHWGLVAIIGTGVFQTLCSAGFEPIAWLFMSIPILIVCFFLAVAIFSSSIRVNNGRHRSRGYNPCNMCGQEERNCGCQQEKPKCNRTRCDMCNGCGCNRCLGNSYDD